ncbi:DsbA family protein [Patescibacteria group bacterium]|nr:DsbA family protein [Patescibacteria group bacterium]MBU1951893.1 DsbA family protein [Patescibacteria group bacterium]
MSEDKQKSFFDSMSPKASFVFGLTLGVAIISIVGFATVLSMSADGDADSKTAETNTNKNTAQANTNTAVAPTATVIKLAAITDSDNIRGDKNAPITLVEFSDFECPYCSRLFPTLEALLDKYEGEVRLVYKHFPLTSIHDQAVPAAEASECAGDQSKFWEYHDALYSDQSKLADGYYSELAATLGLNTTQFDDCFNSRKYQERVATQSVEAQAAGGQGTPYTVMIDADGNTTPLNGAIPQANFEVVIDQALGK